MIAHPRRTPGGLRRSSEEQQGEISKQNDNPAINDLTPRDNISEGFPSFTFRISVKGMFGLITDIISRL